MLNLSFLIMENVPHDPVALFSWWHFFLVALLLVAGPVAHGKAYGYLFFDYLNMLYSSFPMKNVPHDPVAHLVAHFPVAHLVAHS